MNTGVSLVAQSVKNLPAVQETGFNPWVGKTPEGGHGNPLQYSYLENPMDRGAWWVTVHGVTESGITEVTEHACMWRSVTQKWTDYYNIT